MRLLSTAVGTLALLHVLTASAQAPAPVGEIKGSAVQHSADSLRGVLEQADVVLPAKLTGQAVWAGKWKDLPTLPATPTPVVVFMHGSSGLGLKAIGEWQQWLATLGVASVAPNSFALPQRLTYSSPIDKNVYEQIHALRASEIAPVVAALAKSAWADPARLVLAGTSEGSVPVARYRGTEFAGRILYAWSCENNYFVREPQNALEADKPMLNVISSTDPFFSPSNSWVGNPAAQGHCGAALGKNGKATVVLIPGAPHTLLNLPAARAATATFLGDIAR